MVYWFLIEVAIWTTRDSISLMEQGKVRRATRTFSDLLELATAAARLTRPANSPIAKIEVSLCPLISRRDCPATHC
jgi:hypothetical protein